MTTANTALRITELDFDSIKANLKDYLNSQAEFTDYNFEGSGLSVLLDILAYNTYYQNMQLHLTGNEMFLDTAQIRSSVISHAKNLGYTPRSRTAATARVNIEVTPGALEDNAATTLEMERYTRFISNPEDGVAYDFITLNSDIAAKANGTFMFSNVEISQGIQVSQQYTVIDNGSDIKFNIPSSKIDTNSIRVSVQESVSNTYTTTYSRANDITQLTGNTTSYFLEEDAVSNGEYVLAFGDGVLGKRLSNNNIVLVNYIETEGENGNDFDSFVASDGINGYSANVVVTTLEMASGGASKETVEEIRFRAPRFYTAQNRMVSKNDYKTLIQSDYPNIDAVSVWGGEDNDPPIYGKMFISLKPVDNYEISNLEKQRIIDHIIENRSVLTVFPEIVTPDYTYLLVRATVNYNPAATNLDESELRSLIRAAILDYRETHLQSFDSVFRKSRLQRAIEDVDPSIRSSTVTVFAQKRFVPTLGETKNYNLQFNIPLYKSGINSSDKLFSYPSVTMLDDNEISREVFIEELVNSFSGIDSVKVTDVGQNYTEIPTVTITGDGTGATAEAKIINGKVNSITVTNGGINYTRATVSITGGGSGSGATAEAVLESKNGILRSYYFKNSGEKVIVDDEIATIDYLEGTVEFTSLNLSEIGDNTYYDPDTVTINSQPEGNTIRTFRNQILDIDENDASSILITMVKEET